MPIQYNSDLSYEEVAKLLAYNSETGVLKWKVRASSRAGPGDIAGSLHRFGYMVIRVNNKAYKAHRIAWLIHYKEWPGTQVDHINGDKADNRLANLRLATASQNQQNRAIDRDNILGYQGVTIKSGGRLKRTRYQAQIQVDKVHRYLGVFDTPEEAHAAYLKAKAELHLFQPVPRGKSQ